MLFSFYFLRLNRQIFLKHKYYIRKHKFMFLLEKSHKMMHYSSSLPSMAVLRCSRSCVSLETQRALHVSSSHTASFTHLHHLHDPLGSNFLTFNFQLNPKLLQFKSQILETTFNYSSMQENIFNIVFL